MELVDAVGDPALQGHRHRHEQRPISHVGQDPPFGDAGELALEDLEQRLQDRLAGVEVAVLKVELELQIEGDEVLGLDCQDLRLGLQGAGAIETLRRDGKIDPGFHEHRVELDRLLIGSDGLLVPSQLAQRSAESEIGHRVIGIGSDGALGDLARFGQPA